MSLMVKRNPFSIKYYKRKWKMQFAVKQTYPTVGWFIDLFRRKGAINTPYDSSHRILP